MSAGPTEEISASTHERDSPVSVVPHSRALSPGGVEVFRSR